MGLILDMSPRNLEKILYFAAYIVTDPGDTAPWLQRSSYRERSTEKLREKYGGRLQSRYGRRGSKGTALTQIDLDALSEDLREKLKGATGQKKIRIVRRLEVVEALRLSNNKPEWMIMDVIPVIPPDLRPMVQLDGGRFATSDLKRPVQKSYKQKQQIKETAGAWSA